MSSGDLFSGTLIDFKYEKILHSMYHPFAD
jgi:hypothetical protein